MSLRNQVTPIDPKTAHPIIPTNAKVHISYSELVQKLGGANQIEKSCSLHEKRAISLKWSEGYSNWEEFSIQPSDTADKNTNTKWHVQFRGGQFTVYDSHATKTTEQNKPIIKNQCRKWHIGASEGADLDAFIMYLMR